MEEKVLEAPAKPRRRARKASVKAEAPQAPEVVETLTPEQAEATGSFTSPGAPPVEERGGEPTPQEAGPATAHAHTGFAKLPETTVFCRPGAAPPLQPPPEVLSERERLERELAADPRVGSLAPEEDPGAWFRRAVPAVAACPPRFRCEHASAIRAGFAGRQGSARGLRVLVSGQEPEGGRRRVKLSVVGPGRLPTLSEVFEVKDAFLPGLRALIELPAAPLQAGGARAAYDTLTMVAFPGREGDESDGG